MKWSYMLLGPAAMLASCGLLDDPERETAVTQGTAEIEALVERLETSLQSNVREVDRPWHGSSQPQETERPAFSPLLSRQDAIHLQSTDNVSLIELATILEQTTRLPVQVRTFYSDSEDQPLEFIVTERHPMDYRGSLGHVLDQIASSYDIFWDFDGTTITLEPLKTRRWFLPIPIGATQFDQSSSGLGGGTTTISTSTNHTLDPWNSLERLLQRELVAPANIGIYRDIGQLVVLGRPSDMARIERAIKEQLFIYRHRIGLEIAVYYVNTDDLDQFNIQLTALLRRGSGLPQVVTTGSAVPPAGNVRVFGSQTVPGNQAVTTAGNVLLQARAAEENAQRLVSNPSLRGADLTEAEALAALTTARANTAAAANSLAQAQSISLEGATPATFLDFQNLATNEAVVDYRQGSSVTLSGVPTPIVLSRISNYVSSVSIDEEGRTTLETSTINEGISIHAIPRLIERNQIQLTLTVLQNALVALQRFASGSASLQLPTTDHRSVSADTVLRPGETLILSGYEQDVTLTGNSRGFLGTGRRGETTKIRMVVLVRPALLALPDN